MVTSAQHYPLSGLRVCAPVVACLSNRSAGGGKGRGHERVEGNSGVQIVGEGRVRCGEINSGESCGDGHAWEGMGADDLLCSRNARSGRSISPHPSREGKLDLRELFPWSEA